MHPRSDTRPGLRRWVAASPRRRLAAPLLSPAGLLVRAALLALAFGAAHVAGWREYTSVLSGTAVGGVGATLGGVLYVLLSFGAVVAVPITVLAAVVFALLAARGRRSPAGQAGGVAGSSSP